MMRAMTQPPDLDALARRYLDLWQDQMTRMANDPTTAEMMARTLSVISKTAQAFTTATSRSSGGSQQETSSPDATPDAASTSDTDAGTPCDQSATTVRSGDHGGQGSPSPSDGAATAAAVPADGGVDLSRLLGRIADLEARVAELEGRLPAAAASADQESA